MLLNLTELERALLRWLALDLLAAARPRRRRRKPRQQRRRARCARRPGISGRLYPQRPARARTEGRRARKRVDSRNYGAQ